ncbi:TPA: hypothetical protein JG832_002441 [Enterobacter hormaechei subsp. xiangfangensis]|nr:hypothetical protein [Enterobacter hormaechei subsp. xiangfangensis]HAV1890577.1 hypothetical protein [Enterobacter hormaechei subsp. xiangfangensis]
MTELNTNPDAGSFAALVETIIDKARVNAIQPETLATVLRDFLHTRIRHYADFLNIDAYELLVALENNRKITAPNYYQAAHFPLLDKDEVFVLRNLEHYRQIVGVTGFRCPACGEISLENPFECNHWKKGKPCGWKSYGFFKTMGKGLRLILRENFLTDPVVHEIFMPVALEHLFENGKLLPGAKLPD